MGSDHVAYVVVLLVCAAELLSVGGTYDYPNRTNWAGNVVFRRDVFLQPGATSRIRTLVRSEEKVKVVGMRHSFNTIADIDDAQLSLMKRLRKVVALDVKAETVTVDASITYTQLCPHLHRRGFALHNTASFTDLTVAGAISTATHGSGVGNGILASSVSRLEFVTANGEVVKYSRNGTNAREFHGVVVGLGAVGVITRITLDLQPAFTMRQWVYENLPLKKLTHHFDVIMSSGYSVSLFTDWQKKRINQVWIKARVDHGHQFKAPKQYFGATRATRKLHPSGLNPENCTEQFGNTGPWYLRLPHFQPGTTPVVGDELQSEYFVARSHAVEAILAVESLREQLKPHLFISEIRTIAGDALWMSTMQGRDSVAIHFTWKKNLAAVKRLLPLVECKLAKFGPRPHWGKLFTIPPSELRLRYEKLGDFVRLAKKTDPTGKFRNDFLNTNVFA